MLNTMMLVLLISIGIVFIRMIRGKNIWEKLLSLNLIAIMIVMIIITYAVEYQIELIMDIAIAYSIIGFLSLILLAKFIAGGRK
ncbi:pH regulation protein F [Acidaminobacter sp. JC074]|uniref:monovalent cation/H+ antiporter complex subunit F n=1 Tax=Acidaminobacter sp. JC074 TaxID=2530199 RepID=UPI001F0EA5AA|nr:monovalent cation/H+ antiporter complex subunit F [Acidaminobacter sp. JC074]MCH4887311.1 pH regulation protein F [Acidaminobacter sp. JC074]